ncbi:MAG: RsmB/NOP family class I SAM-dependent RNA methyltransferase [Cyanobacteria bacterium J06635_15]
MAQPSKLLTKLSRRLFEHSEQQTTFINALTTPSPFAPTILWTKSRPEPYPFERLERLPWQPTSVDRLAPTTQLGKHPLHNTGYFYCLDFSSVFAASVVQAIAQPISTVLDLCAAPGGKSLLVWQLLQPQLLLSNEVIRKRLRILIANLKRCGATDAIALNLDPKLIAAAIPETADLVLVDAPCSGQSLLAKGDKAPGCFHPVSINQNANRQKRILAEATHTVAPGGYLAYMTCTYAPEENEKVCRWLRDRFPQLQPISVPHLSAFQSPLTEMPCYRLWPQSGLGAGAFTCLFQDQSPPVTVTPMSPDFIERYGFRIYPA